MFELSSSAAASKSEIYTLLLQQTAALLGGERALIANAANMTALIYHILPDVNWAGFYFLRAEELVLGPFQGKPACVRIPLGRGVCGTAALERKTKVVADVHEFPGHIACDAASRSEIVLPILAEERLIGVLDIDSPIIARFDDVDAAELEKIVQSFVAGTDLSG